MLAEPDERKGLRGWEMLQPPRILVMRIWKLDQRLKRGKVVHFSAKGV